MKKIILLVFLFTFLKFNAQNEFLVFGDDPCLLNYGWQSYRLQDANDGVGNVGFSVFAGQTFNLDYTDSPLILDSFAYQVSQLTGGLDYYLKLYQGEGDTGTELLSLLIDPTNTTSSVVNNGVVNGLQFITDLRNFNILLVPNQTYTIGLSYNDPTNTTFANLFLKAFPDVVQSGNAFYTGTGNDLTRDVACLVRMEYTVHPTDIMNTDVTESTASFSWDVFDIRGGIDSFDWVVVNDGDMPTNTPIAFGNVLTTSASVTGLTASTSYDFYVRANDDCLGNGNISSSWKLFNFSTSTLSNEVFELENLILSPNPATSAITIEGVKNLQNISIYNILGEKVITSDKTTIDVSSLKTGVYLMNITSNLGSVTKRFIKK